MARIVIGATMVRYPLGGMNQWVLGWLIGFKRLGHDVYIVEKSGWPNSCYDLTKGVMTDDPSYGIGVISALLKRFGLQDKWSFVDAKGDYHGLSRERVAEVFSEADLFLDLEWNEWLVEAAVAGLRVFVDGEPGWWQMKMEKSLKAGKDLPQYDHYYTTGGNVGTDRSTAPTAGKKWRHVFPPVLGCEIPYQPVSPDAAFTTVMNWQSHKQVEFNGTMYGQKDVEFLKFLSLPSLTSAALEIAISGPNVPKGALMDSGWRLRNADDIAESINSYRDYIWASKGEFSVAKNVFAATNCGWFGDRPGYYLASGRPVVVQDTGFSDLLPCGRGVFAVRTVEEAADAINEITGDYDSHSKWARDIAIEYLDATKVLRTFLHDLGV